jgi:hypothetical protein
MVTAGPLAIRRELIEYGIPFASWLGQFDSPSAIANIVKQLVDAGDSEGNRSEGLLRVYEPWPSLPGRQFLTSLKLHACVALIFLK